MKLSVSASKIRLPLAAVCDLGSGDGVSPQAARHTVSRRGIEIIIGKEALGRILGNDFSVKEQRADIGVLRRKFDIMRNGKHRHSVGKKRIENTGQHMLCARIEPLCRLVEQQYTRLEQQQLCNSALLLLTAAQVVRMAVEQRLNSYASRDIRYLSVPLGARDLELTEYFKKVGSSARFPR